MRWYLDTSAAIKLLVDERESADLAEHIDAGQQELVSAKSPHTPGFKAKVSQEYLDGLGSFPFLANKYSIGLQTIQSWVSKYKLYGILAFQNKAGNKKYTSKFKTIDRDRKASCRERV